MVFRSYAQLIRKLFNAYQCGPPVGFTPASSWPGVDHSVSRLPIPTIRHLRLAFASAPLLQSLALPEKATRRFIMQKARRQPVGLRPLVGNWFQVLFHSPCGVLFTFPSRYWFAIGLSGVFSLTGWSRQIRAEFLVLRVTQDAARPRLASVTGLSPSKVGLSRTFSSRYRYHNAVLQPRICVATHAVWALPRSLATTGGIISLFSLPLGTKMFQFPRFASLNE